MGCVSLCYTYGYKKTMEKKKQHVLDGQSSTDKKLATTQDRQNMQNSDESIFVSIGCYTLGCCQLGCPQ